MPTKQKAYAENQNNDSSAIQSLYLLSYPDSGELKKIHRPKDNTNIRIRAVTKVEEVDRRKQKPRNGKRTHYLHTRNLIKIKIHVAL